MPDTKVIFSSNYVKEQIEDYQEAFGSLEKIGLALNGAKEGDIVYIEYPYQTFSPGHTSHGGGAIIGKLGADKPSVYYDNKREDACISISINNIMKVSPDISIISDLVKSDEIYSDYAAKYEILFGKKAEKFLEEKFPVALEKYKQLISAKSKD